MLRSMTGFGEAQLEDGHVTVRVEMRAVNNRHLKLSCRLPDGYAALEPQIESRIRQQVRRGVIQLSVHVSREVTAQDYRINPVVLTAYHRQLGEITGQLGSDAAVSPESLLLLPGVIEEASRSGIDLKEQWPLIERTVTQALSQLTRMREDEGRAMEKDLRENCQSINAEVSEIRDRAPCVVQAYQTRLTERLNKLLATHDTQIEPSDIVREVGVMADRVDIAEEIVRLESHLGQFGAIISADESPGRTLEFIIQEMFREVNTIGSKANDASIAQHVVRVKTCIERLREMIQNVE